MKRDIRKSIRHLNRYQVILRIFVKYGFWDVVDKIKIGLIPDLAKKIIDMTNSSSEITLIPYEKAFGKDFDDMQRRVPSTDKLNRIAGFAPDKSLDFILTKVINHFKNRR